MLVTIVSLVWFFGTFAGVVFLVRPVRSWSFAATRSRALVILLVSFFAPPFVLAELGVLPIGIDASGAPIPDAASNTAAAAPASNQAAPAAPDPQADMHAMPSHYLTFTDAQATAANPVMIEHRGLLGLNHVTMGATVTLSGTIRNTATITYRDAHIYCTLNGGSGTYIDHVTANLDEVFPPGKDVHFDNLAMGLAKANWQTSDCRVQYAVAVNGGAPPS